MPSLRSIYETVTEQVWYRRNLHISPTDYVLDVGSGGNPNLRSNVLCDKFLLDAGERQGTPLVVDRPFVAGDVQNLPFKDGAFDYVMLSHVLEHVADPELTLRELQRVARAGYIETPSAAWEKISGFPFHRWLVRSDGQTLTVERKKAAIHDPEVRAWSEAVLSDPRAWTYFWSNRRRFGVYTSHSWSHRIAFRVEDSGEMPAEEFIQAELADPEEANIRRAGDGGPLWRLQQLVSRRLRRHSDRPPEAVYGVVCCPTCRGDLERVDKGTMRCLSCGGKYPIHPLGIPLLLRECRQAPLMSVALNTPDPAPNR